MRNFISLPPFCIHDPTLRAPPGIDSENGLTATACAPVPIDPGMLVAFFSYSHWCNENDDLAQTDARSAAMLVGTSCEN